MIAIRSGFDRRSNINRRQMNIPVKAERRLNERRRKGEHRGKWVRTSRWSSVDQDQMNRFLWHILK